MPRRPPPRSPWHRVPPSRVHLLCLQRGQGQAESRRTSDNKPGIRAPAHTAKAECAGVAPGEEPTAGWQRRWWSLAAFLVLPTADGNGGWWPHLWVEPPGRGDGSSFLSAVQRAFRGSGVHTNASASNAPSPCDCRHPLGSIRFGLPGRGGPCPHPESLRPRCPYGANLG